MTANDNEEARLRSVAVQNAQSVLSVRLHAEDELRKQSEWLRITLASIGDGVISSDAQGRITFLNHVAEELTGWTAAEAVGRGLHEVFHIVDPDTRQPAKNPAIEALASAGAHSLSSHVVLIGRSGAERPIDESAAPILDDAGQPIGVVLVFRDASLRRLVEETQARLAAIVESTSDAIVSKTLSDGIIRTWNAAAERMFGYAAQEAIGQPITLIIPLDRRAEEQAIIERLRRGERVEHFDTIRVAKDGRLLDVSLTISPIFDREGHIIGASKIARDVTDRKVMENELRSRTEQLIEVDRKKDDFISLLAHELRNPLAPLRNGLEVMRLAANDPAALARTRTMMERQLGHLVRLVDDLLDISRFNRKKIELRRRRVPLADVVDNAIEIVHSDMTAAGHEFTLSLPADAVYLNADLTRLGQALGNLLDNSIKFTEPGGHVWLTAARRASEISISVRDTGVGILESDIPHVFDMFAQTGHADRGSGLGVGLALAKGFVELHGGTVSAASEGKGKGSTFTVTLPTLESEAT